MCRVLAYLGSQIPLENLLYKPDSSLLKQAYRPQMLQMLNLAGFGMMAWDPASYLPDIPFRYTKVTVSSFVFGNGNSTETIPTGPPFARYRAHHSQKARLRVVRSSKAINAQRARINRIPLATANTCNGADSPTRYGLPCFRQSVGGRQPQADCLSDTRPRAVSVTCFSGRSGWHHPSASSSCLCIPVGNRYAAASSFVSPYPSRRSDQQTETARLLFRRQSTPFQA